MKWHPFAEKFPLLEGAEWETFKASIKETRGPTEPITYRLVKGKREYLDGRNRAKACSELRIKCRDKAVRCPDEEVKAFIMRNNVHRRHLTSEFRQSIVAELRADGQSERVIAESLGVSQATVHRDLQQVDSNESTQKSNGEATVVGKDKKRYKARKPLKLCDRCKRVGAVKDCPACAELRGRKQKKSREPGEDDKPDKSKAKQGEPLFDMREFETDFGRLLRQIDKFGKLHKCKESDEAKELRTSLTKWMKEFKEWVKEVKTAKA